MMPTYRVHAYPTNPYFHGAFPGHNAFTAESLAQALAPVIIQELVAAPQGGYDIMVDMRRQDHAEAIADIENALSSFGYSMTQAVVTEWATSTLESAIVGIGAGGLVGGSATRNQIGALISAAIGCLVGLGVGSSMRRVVAMYQADRLRHYPYGWQLTALPLPGPDAAPGPAFA